MSENKNPGCRKCVHYIPNFDRLPILTGYIPREQHLCGHPSHVTIKHNYTRGKITVYGGCAEINSGCNCGRFEPKSFWEKLFGRVETK